MIKSLLTVTAVAAGLIALAPAQKAEARVNLDIGVGIAVVDRGYDGGYDYGRDYGYDGYVYEYGRRDGYYDAEPAYYDDRGISCKKGRKYVRQAGFRDIEVLDCEGRFYTYRAYRHDRPFIIKMNRRGEIVRAEPVYRR